MRTFACCLTIAAATLLPQSPGIDPEKVLAEQLHFTEKEVADARQGQPVVKVDVKGDEIAAVGAIRLPGRKERLADWVKNIGHFRSAAELGVAQPVPQPPSLAAFAGLTLAAKDLDSLKKCTAENCDLRATTGAIAELQRTGMSGADDVFRRMLFGELTHYIQNGNAYAVGDMARKAATLTALSPELVGFVEKYPSASLTGSEQLFYWSSTTARDVPIIGLHHLIVYKPRPGVIWIVDKNVYASRYFDTGVLVIGLYDAPEGNGFYGVAGSRVKSGYIGGKGAFVRRQVTGAASDSVKIYLEWIRDSLGAG